MLKWGLLISIIRSNYQMHQPNSSSTYVLKKTFFFCPNFHYILKYLQMVVETIGYIEPIGTTERFPQRIVSYFCWMQAHSSFLHLAVDTFMVEDAVEAIGFGQFQWKLSILTGLSWVRLASLALFLSTVMEILRVFIEKSHPETH